MLSGIDYFILTYVCPFPPSVGLLEAGTGATELLGSQEALSVTPALPPMPPSVPATGFVLFPHPKFCWL